MARVNTDHFGDFFSNNINIESRIIYIGAPSDESSHEISFKTSSEIIKSLILLSNISSDQITVILSTYGGDFYATMAIYDAMKMSTCPIKVIGIGGVFSGGSIILQGADAGLRYLTENTTLMLHDGSDNPGDNHVRDIERWADYGKKMRTRMYNIFASNCSLTDKKFKKADFWRKKLDHDWIMDADEAISWGLADKICDKIE